MSIARPRTFALAAALAFGAAVLTGTSAYAEDRPATHGAVAEAVPAAKSTQRIAAGKTTPGRGWAVFTDSTIYIDVDTSSAHFTGDPVYTISVGGNSDQWLLSGTSAVYSPTSTGFRVYVRSIDGSPINPGTAVRFQWYVNWIGVDNP